MKALYEELDVLMKQCWIIKRDVTVTFEINECGEYIDKTVKTTTVYHNWKDAPHNELCINGINMKRIDGIDDREHFVLQEFSIVTDCKDSGYTLSNDDIKIRSITEDNGVYDLEIACD